MENETKRSIVRNLTRAAAVGTGLALTLAAAPAVAAPPDTWEDPDNGSALGALLLLIGAPLAVIAVIVLLTYLPTMTGRRPAGTAVAFQERPEWFGGPRQGTEAPAVAEAGAEASKEKGGASARW